MSRPLLGQLDYVVRWQKEIQDMKTEHVTKPINDGNFTGEIGQVDTMVKCPSCPNCKSENTEPETEKIYYQMFAYKCLDCEYKF